MKKAKKYPLFKVFVNEKRILNNLNSVLTSGFINEGEEVAILGSRLQEFLRVEHLTLTNSGTSSLTLALKACGLTPGDEVLTVSMTCIATNTPIINLGGKINWVDIDPDTGSIELNDLERKIGKRTKAIIFVDWAGNPCDLDGLGEISSKYDIPLVQDAAHAFGAQWRNKSVANYADFTCFSFQAIKHFTTGDGGAIVCRDEENHKLVRKLKWFGLDRDNLKDAKGEWKGQRWEADISVGEVGYKFNMNNISAAIGLANLESIDSIISRHRQNAKVYETLLDQHELIKLISLPKYAHSSNWVFTLRVLVNEKERNLVLEKLNAENIEAGLVHIPNHNYSAFSEFYSPLPGTDEFQRTQISLPCGWWMDEEDCKYIAERLIQHLDDSLEYDSHVGN